MANASEDSEEMCVCEREDAREHVEGEIAGGSYHRESVPYQQKDNARHTSAGGRSGP